jgi:regulator of sigma E protease
LDFGAALRVTLRLGLNSSFSKRTVGGAFAYSGEMATSVLKTVGELITGAFGDQTADVVGGPVSTIGQTAQIAIASPFSFLYMASFIGVNLAVFNLLPVPALDGCRVIFCIIEWIRKKPLNRKIEAAINFAGIVFLFGFAILIDLLKLF